MYASILIALDETDLEVQIHNQEDGEILIQTEDLYGIATYPDVSIRFPGNRTLDIYVNARLVHSIRVEDK
jgi:hypothetical protein